MDTEKLINLVKEKDLLYNLRNRNYKNVLLKEITWKEIGEKFNESGAVARKKWKTVKDGYYRYKKNIKGSTGSGRVLGTAYIWAEQLRFLDDFTVNRCTTSNVVHLSARSSQDSVATDADTGTSSSEPFLAPPSPLSPRPTLSPLSSMSSCTTSSPLSPRPVETRPRHSRRTASQPSEVNQIIDYLRNKPKNSREKDATDYLFQSYAESFKTYPPAVQVDVKLDMAKIFAEAELRILRESRTTGQMNVVMSSAFSMISDSDAQSNTEDMDEAAESNLEENN